MVEPHCSKFRIITAIFRVSEYLGFLPYTTFLSELTATEHVWYRTPRDFQLSGRDCPNAILVQFLIQELCMDISAWNGRIKRDQYSNGYNTEQITAQQWCLKRSIKRDQYSKGYNTEQITAQLGLKRSHQTGSVLKGLQHWTDHGTTGLEKVTSNGISTQRVTTLNRSRHNWAWNVHIKRDQYSNGYNTEQITAQQGLKRPHQTGSVFKRLQHWTDHGTTGLETSTSNGISTQTVTTLNRSRHNRAWNGHIKRDQYSNGYNKQISVSVYSENRSHGKTK